MDKNILIKVADKIATAIEKIERMHTTDGIFGKLDVVLRLDSKRWSHDEKLQMVDYFCAKVPDTTLRNNMWDAYAGRIR